MENLIINGIDHSVFDIEWAMASIFPLEHIQRANLATATPDECAEAGIEYIDPPVLCPRPIGGAKSNTASWCIGNGHCGCCIAPEPQSPKDE